MTLKWVRGRNTLAFPLYSIQMHNGSVQTVWNSYIRDFQSCVQVDDLMFQTSTQNERESLWHDSRVCCLSLIAVYLLMASTPPLLFPSILTCELYTQECIHSLPRKLQRARTESWLARTYVVTDRLWLHVQCSCQCSSFHLSNSWWGFK